MGISRLSLSWMEGCFFCDFFPVAMPFLRGIYGRAKAGHGVDGCIQGRAGTETGNGRGV